MADTFRNRDNKSNPAERWYLITPSANDLAPVPRGIVCTAGGDITMEDAAGTALPLTGVTADPQPLPYRPLKVTAATGTFYAVY